ncbi:heavy metal-binding domain-containing protein [Dactylosporangium sp. CS-047395]|uniref:heavy metal-binding domain-containing protein n=1 Tax=Dactylosporangium sp. CS-047395 TaxID=3239936 RepID=UPI003D8C4488
MTGSRDVGGFAALRAVGFEPVRPVSGTAVFLVGPGFATCRSRTLKVPETDDISVQFERHIRRVALDRMRRHCVEAGGDGVIGVELAVRPFLGGVGAEGDETLEFVATGTAVRLAGVTRRRLKEKPFTAGVSAAELAKLLQAAWMPVAVVLGVGVKVVHDRATEVEQSSVDNVELSTATKLVRATRAAARDGLVRDAGLAGAHTVIEHGASLKVYEEACEVPRPQDSFVATARGVEIEPVDRIAVATMTGTALVRLRKPVGAGSARPLSMMRLDRDRRSAVNWRQAP